MAVKPDRDLIASWWNAGKSLSQIAAKLEGFSRSAIGGLIYRMRGKGIDLVRRPTSNNNLPRKPSSRRGESPTQAQPRRKKRVHTAPACREVGVNPPKVPPLPALIHHGLHIPFLETVEGQCRWVLDDGTCCGHPTIVRSWCRHHAEICLNFLR